MNHLEKRYRTWVATHQAVFDLFEKFALERLQASKRFGIGALAERVRWEVATTWGKDEQGYKLNNNHSAYIARDLINKHSDLKGLIQTRVTHA